jgi:hypothetical protein
MQSGQNTPNRATGQQGNRATGQQGKIPNYTKRHADSSQLSLKQNFLTELIYHKLISSHLQKLPKAVLWTAAVRWTTGLFIYAGGRVFWASPKHKYAQEHFMKRKGLLLLVLATLVAGGVFAQKVGDTVQVGGDSYNIESVNGDVITMRKGMGLDGVWRESSSQTRTINISGNTSVFTEFGASAVVQAAVKKGGYKIGGQYLRNLTRTGNLTWSGQECGLNSNADPIWLDCTITMSADGKNFQLRTTAGAASYTRQQGSSNNTASAPAPVINNSGMTFTSIPAFKTWLDGQPDNSNVNPYYVRVNISNINGGSNAGGSLGNAINNKINANKYIDLDLSGSTFNSVPDSAFANGKTITNVTLPGRVNGIGNYAFAHCTSLERITLGSNVNSFGTYAFQNCSSLESITFPASVQGIGAWAFNGCTSLNSVTFQGTIPAGGFNNSNPFLGDLRNKFYASDKENGTPGTYTRAGNTWTKR